MKYVNRPVINAAQKMSLKMTKNIVEKADLMLKKDMEHKEITREQENLKIGSPQYEREF